MNITDLFSIAKLINLLTSITHAIQSQFKSDVKLRRRFLNVCRSHGIEETQIYKIFPNNDLLPTDFSNLTSTCKKLTPKLIEEFCNLFDVDRDWLETGYGPCQNEGYTYKQISEIEKIQSELRDSFSDKSIVKLVVLAPSNIDLTNFHTFSPTTPVVIAYSVHHKIDDDMTVTLYRHTEILFWGYQKTRVHLRAIVDIADKNRFMVSGAYAPASVIRRFNKGKICFAEAVSKRRAIWDPIKELPNKANDIERELLDNYYQTGTLP